MERSSQSRPGGPTGVSAPAIKSAIAVGDERIICHGTSTAVEGVPPAGSVTVPMVMLAVEELNSSNLSTPSCPLGYAEYAAFTGTEVPLPPERFFTKMLH